MLVRKFLKHREARHRQEWAQGRGWNESTIAAVQILSDIEDLQYEDIENFYGAPVEIGPTEFSVFMEEEDDSTG